MEEETWKKHTLRQYIYICPIDRVDNICMRGVRVGCGAMMHATTKQASNFCNKTNQPKIYLSIFFFVMFYSSLVPCVSPAFSSGVLCVGWLLQPTLSRPSLLQQKKKTILKINNNHIYTYLGQIIIEPSGWNNIFSMPSYLNSTRRLVKGQLRTE